MGRWMTAARQHGKTETHRLNPLQPCTVKAMQTLYIQAEKILAPSQRGTSIHDDAKFTLQCQEKLCSCFAAVLLNTIIIQCEAEINSMAPRMHIYTKGQFRVANYLFFFFFCRSVRKQTQGEDVIFHICSGTKSQGSWSIGAATAVCCFTMPTQRLICTAASSMHCSHLGLKSHFRVTQNASVQFKYTVHTRTAKIHSKGWYWISEALPLMVRGL